MENFFPLIYVPHGIGHVCITNGQMTERTKCSNGGVHVGLDWKILKIRDQIESNK